MKVASPVLRGVGRSNAPGLPDPQPAQKLSVLIIGKPLERSDPRSGCPRLPLISVAVLMSQAAVMLSS